jgi:hypothetical protein
VATRFAPENDRLYCGKLKEESRMTTFRTLLVGAAIGAVLAVAGVATTLAVISPTAGEVASQMAKKAARGGTGGTTAADPLAPPNFYGSR